MHIIYSQLKNIPIYNFANCCLNIIRNEIGSNDNDHDTFIYNNGDGICYGDCGDGYGCGFDCGYLDGDGEIDFNIYGLLEK